MIGNGSISLAQQIERGQIQNEARVAEQVNPPTFQIEADELRHLRRFKQFCIEKGLRFFPAKPATVAAWIANEAAAGLAVEAIEASLRGIELLHTNANYANPVSCPAPRAELEKLIGPQAPRSWKRSEQLLFASLPPEIRAVILRRSKQDEVIVRRLQNDTAALFNSAWCSLEHGKETNEQQAS